MTCRSQKLYNPGPFDSALPTNLAYFCYKRTWLLTGAGAKAKTSSNKTAFSLSQLSILGWDFVLLSDSWAKFQAVPTAAVCNTIKLSYTCCWPVPAALLSDCWANCQAAPPAVVLDSAQLSAVYLVCWTKSIVRKKIVCSLHLFIIINIIMLVKTTSSWFFCKISGTKKVKGIFSFENY